MVLSDQDLDMAEERILSILREEHEPVEPTKLFDQLADQGVSPLLARAAIWYLIDRAAIALTRTRLLEVTPAGRAAPAMELVAAR